MSEQWRPVPGYEGLYEVSDFGNVRSLDRHILTRRRTGDFGKRCLGKPKIPTPHPKDAYLRVWLCRDGRTAARTVHSLVAEAFLGPRAADQEVCHANGNGHDNRLVNLRYDTREANREDSRKMDRLAVGERIAQHKLSAEQVREIRASAETPQQLARRYPVTWRQIRRIKNRENWRHV